MLMQYAYSCGLEGKRCVFICSKQKIHSSPPVMSSSIEELDDNALNQISMK